MRLARCIPLGVSLCALLYLLVLLRRDSGDEDEVGLLFRLEMSWGDH